MIADDKEVHQFTFPDWAIQIKARELVTPRGHAELEPRVFDLLLFLIQNRHRIVSKDELLNQVWQTVHVSESVLARAIMKIRKALSEGGIEGDWIRTAHRVGYQFKGEPVSLEAKRELPSSVPSARIKRIAFLPFENRTGDALLDWVELGLLTLTARALAASEFVAVDALEGVLQALAPLALTTSFEEKLQHLRNALGTESVVRTVVSNAEPGQYRLSWSVWLTGNVMRQGDLMGSQLPALALELASALAGAFGATPEVVPPKIDLTRDRISPWRPTAVPFRRMRKNNIRRHCR